MNTPPRLRLVHDRRPAPGEDTRAPPDGVDSERDGADPQRDGADDDRARVEPDAAADDGAQARARRARLARQVFIALVAFQFLGASFDAPRDWRYAAQGAVAPPAWLAFPCTIALAAATVRLALGRARGGVRLTYLLAAAGYALAIPFWGLASPLTTPFEFGATLALAGAWLVHRERLVLQQADSGAVP